MNNKPQPTTDEQVLAIKGQLRAAWIILDSPMDKIVAEFILSLLSTRDAEHKKVVEQLQSDLVTAQARVEAYKKWALELAIKCGHSEFHSWPPESTIEGYITELTHDLIAAREALGRFGKHQQLCNRAIQLHGNSTPYKCTCGLDAALNKLKE